MANEFKVGDQVQWSMSAGGKQYHKEGTISEIVAAGKVPSAPGLKKPNVKFGRDVTSYLVKTANGIYWPRVPGLRAMESEATTGEVVSPLTQPVPKML